MADKVLGDFPADVWDKMEEWAKQVLAGYSIVRVDNQGNTERPRHFALHDVVGKCLRVRYSFLLMFSNDPDVFHSERYGELVLTITGVQVHCWTNGERAIHLDVTPCEFPHTDSAIHRITGFFIKMDSTDDVVNIHKLGFNRLDQGDVSTAQPFHFNRAQIVSAVILWN